MDTSNQFHLWVFADPAERIGFGYGERMIVDTAKEAYTIGAKQRPFAADERPADALTPTQAEQRARERGLPVK